MSKAAASSINELKSKVMYAQNQLLNQQKERTFRGQNHCSSRNEKLGGYS